MKDNRHKALDYILAHEGGYAERPEEGGGAVNMGVTFAVFKAWVALKKIGDPDRLTWADLKALKRWEAEDIYGAQYCEPIHFDELPSGVDYCVLDAAVLGGVTGAIKLLQTALRIEPIDGHFGLRTRWAANHRDNLQLINDFCEARLAKYRMFKGRWNKVANAKSGKTWGQIWSERISTVKARALEMAKA
jgi:lysozyme family protein